MKKIRILLIEENRLLREGIISMLKEQKDIKFIAIPEYNKIIVIKIQNLKPNIILLGIGSRCLNNITFVKGTKKDFPEAKIIIMDISPIQKEINQLVKSGVSGLILKDASFEDFLLTIRKVAAGTNVFPSEQNETLFSKIIEYAVKDGKLDLEEIATITKREHEIIKHISNGLSNKDIGTILNVSNFTVKSHIHNIMYKLELHSRLEVANYSYANY